MQPSTLIIGGIRLDDNAKAVTVDGENAALTPKEYDILRFLMKNASTVFSPSEIYRRVWDDVPLNAAGAIAVHHPAPAGRRSRSTPQSRGTSR